MLLRPARPALPARLLPRRAAAATLAAGLALLAACGGGDGPTPPTTEPPPATQVASVRITRGGTDVGTGPIALEIGQSVDLVAVPLSASGATLTRPVAWKSDANGIATVDPTSGRVTAVAVGTTLLTATSDTRSSTVSVAVQGPLSVALEGPGAGTVTGTGLACTGPGAAGCNASYAPGTSVTLTATPDGNSTFGAWGGACAGSGSAPTCTVTLDQARAVTASFARRRVNVTLTLSGQGSGNVVITGANVSGQSTCVLPAGQGTASCAVTVDAGVATNLTAAPDTATSQAGSWSGACAGPATQACLQRVFTADGGVGVTFDVRTATPASVDSVVVTLVGSPPAASLVGDLAITGTLNGRPIGSLFTIGMQTNTPSARFAFAVDRGTSVGLRFQSGTGTRFVSWGGVCAAAGTPGSPAQCGIGTTSQLTEVVITVAPR